MDLLNKQHPHAANWHLRQITDHALKLVEELKLEAERSTAVAGVGTLKKAEKFDESLTTRLTSFLYPTIGDGRWQKRSEMHTPEFAAWYKNAKALIAEFEREIAITRTKTSKIAEHNAEVMSSVMALMTQVGVPARKTVQSKARTKVSFNEVEAGYMSDLRAQRRVFEEDNTLGPAAVATMCKTQLDAWLQAQRVIKKTLDDAALMRELLFLAKPIKEAYGFAIHPPEHTPLAFINMLLMGLDVNYPDSSASNYELNKQVTNVVGRLYTAGLIHYDTMVRVYHAMPVGVAQINETHVDPDDLE